MLRTISLYFLLAAAPLYAEEAATFAGLAGAKLLDSGTMVVAGGTPSDRSEVFEYVQRADGGFVLLNTVTSASGKFRVQGRYDYDAKWRPQAGHGIGFYDGKPVDVSIKLEGREIAISVRPQDGSPAKSLARTCASDCFLDMAPSMTSMYVMTRHYDRKRGGTQQFEWASQDLDKDYTMSGGKVDMAFKGEMPVKRVGGQKLDVRHFIFTETLPNPAGGTYALDFDIWTDTADRPLGYRITKAGGRPINTIGWRMGYEDLQSALLQAPSR